MNEKIKNIIASVLQIDDSTLEDESSPDTIEGWDSINQMNIVMALEEEFDIEFTEEQILNMLNVKLIYITVEEALNNA